MEKEEKKIIYFKNMEMESELKKIRRELEYIAFAFASILAYILFFKL